MYKTILVSIDGSEPSDNALDHAVMLATTFKSRLILLIVVQRVMIPMFPDEGFGGVPLSAAKDMAQYQDKMRRVYKNVLDESKAKIRKKHPNLLIDSILKEGRPSATITKYAQEYGADLIVMGSRGIGGYTGWILGSTTRRVVDSCTKPILIVK
ncbi:MAG: universal stress protein [Candidatus Bathyarchaeota archaeon]|jgi:nucleotide-binding universal stress UspA family protein|nr:universal stress protein [Candidatus Bathyarchaeota archaeon]